MSSTARKPSARPSPSGSSTRSGAAALARAAPFALFIAFLAVQPLLEGRLDSRWLVAARGVAVGLVLAFFWRRYSELREGPAASAGNWLLAAAVGAAAFGAWITFDTGWSTFSSGPGFSPLREDGSLDVTLVVLRLLGMVAVVPLMEELFWRSLVMRWIDKRDFLALDARTASLAAVAVSSVLFALEHSQWFAGLLAGFGYAWLYRRTGNLRVAVASHALTNGLLGAWILATQDWRYW